MSNIDVSVVIPVYNVSEYLDECISSVCKQTMKNIEIIIIDDGSTDNSADICKKWEKKDNRIIFICGPNYGVSTARNKGIEVSKGKWIAFVDSDDWTEPNYLELLYENAEKNNADVSICGFFYNYPDDELISGHYNSDMLFQGKEEIRQIQIQVMARKMCKMKNNSGDRVGAPWGKLFNAKLIKSNGISYIPALKRSQDIVFSLYVLEIAEKISYVNIPAYHYRITEGSACNKYSEQILTNVNAYLNEIQNFIYKYHKNDIFFQDAFYTKVCTSIHKCMFQYFFHKQYPNSFSIMKKELEDYISQPVFSDAMNYVKYKNLDKKEKIFVFCLKHNMIRTLYMLVNIRQRFIKSLRR